MFLSNHSQTYMCIQPKCASTSWKVIFRQAIYKNKTRAPLGRYLEDLPLLQAEKEGKEFGYYDNSIINLQIEELLNQLSPVNWMLCLHWSLNKCLHKATNLPHQA